MNPPTVTVEPGDGSVVYYQPLAKETGTDPHKCRIALFLKITNKEFSPEIPEIHLTDAFISFTNDAQHYPIGSDFVEYDQIPMTNEEIPIYLWNIPSGGTRSLKMHGAGHAYGSQQIIKSSPPSSELSVNLKFLEDEQPVVITKPLQPYSSSVGTVYKFPAKSKDLLLGEFWSSPYSHWSGGNQIFAHDMGVVAWNYSRGKYDRIKGTSTAKLDDYLVWKKPVYAMADGEILRFDNDIEDYESPGNFPPKGFYPAGKGHGNGFTIRHGTDIVTYAHMMKGSLNSKFMGTKGGTNFVSEGELLGLVGNSGNSSEPHLHIDAKNMTTYALRPFLFKDIQVVSIDALTADPYTLWSYANEQGLPAVWTAIWPSIEPEPNYPIPDIARKWKAMAEIIFGILGDGGGLIVSPNTKRPLPNPPPEPLRNISEKRDVILGLALTEIASLASSSEIRKRIQEAGIDTIKKAIAKMSEKHLL